MSVTSAIVLVVDLSLFHTRHHSHPGRLYIAATVLTQGGVLCLCMLTVPALRLQYCCSQFAHLGNLRRRFGTSNTFGIMAVGRRSPVCMQWYGSNGTDLISGQSEDKKNILNWVDPKDKSGEFKRQASSFRNWISSEPGSKFPAEKNRYHLCE